LPSMRRKGEAQRSSLQTLRRNPRRRKSRQARPWREQQQRREPRRTSTNPTNATVGARHAVPGKRTWCNRAIHARVSVAQAGMPVLLKSNSPPAKNDLDRCARCYGLSVHVGGRLESPALHCVDRVLIELPAKFLFYRDVARAPVRVDYDHQ
jgi:hypothetical protein